MPKKEILFSVTKKNLVITWYSGHGPGGTNRNRHKNCCRIHHPDSGVTVTGQDQRESAQNLKSAFHRLADNPKFKLWWKKKAHEILEGETLEQKVDKQMKSEYIRVEVEKDGKWAAWEEQDG